MRSATHCDVVVDELEVDEGRYMFDAMSRDRLGMSREQFMEKLDLGQFDDTDSEDVIRLRLLAPFAR